MASPKAARVILAALHVVFLANAMAAATIWQEKSTPAAKPFRQVVPFAAMLYYEEARNLLKAGKSDEGIAKLKLALQEFPDFFQAHLELGQEYYQRKDLTTAVGWLEKARLVNDRDPRVYRLFGLMLMEQRKLKLAEYALRQALERDPKFAQTYQTHGVVLVDLALSETEAASRANWLTQAEQQLLKSLELSAGKLAFSHWHLARVYEARGEKPKAAQELETFLLKNPNVPNSAAIRENIEKLKSEK
jgi:tetratricopeptide (TPR) repeat protein